MVPNLTGKRLLMLGGYPLMKQAIDKAHELGATVIVTDWNDNAPSKQFADESYSVSTTDVDALEELARSIGVDGVFLGAVDVNMIPGARLCERLGLPCYATEEQFRLTLDKSEFKKLCEQHGVPAVDTLIVGSDQALPTNIDYPVIVKPVDSYSSKGISVCHDAQGLHESLSKALSVSSSGKYLIEPFVCGEDVYLYFTVQNGMVSLSAMADRFVNNADGTTELAPQPQLYLFPSKYIDLYYEQAHDAVQAMIATLGVRNGSFMMQGFVVDEKIRFFEMGLRITGGAGFINIRHQNEIDQMEMHIRYALGDGFGPWDLEEYDNPRFKNPACVVVPLLSNGTIASVEGLDEIKNNKSFVDIVQLVFPGDTIASQGTLNQAFARIFLSAETTQELIEAISFVKRSLIVADETGKNMILPWFEDSEVVEYYKGIGAL